MPLDSNAGRDLHGDAISVHSWLAVALPMAHRAALLTAALATVQSDSEEPSGRDEIVRLADEVATRAAELADAHGVSLDTRPVSSLVRAQFQRALDTLDALVSERLRGHGPLDPTTLRWVHDCVAPFREELVRIDRDARALQEIRL